METRHLSKEMEAIKKNKTEHFQLKNTVSRIKVYFESSVVECRWPGKGSVNLRTGQ